MWRTGASSSPGSKESVCPSTRGQIISIAQLTRAAKHTIELRTERAITALSAMDAAVLHGKSGKVSAIVKGRNTLKVYAASSRFYH
jgi:hypothetical protein